jgi:hypothetical protein
MWHIYDQCWHLYPDIEFDIDQRELIVSGSRSEGANIILEAMYPSNARIIVRDGYNAYPLGDTRYPSFRQRKAEEARFYTMIVPGRAGERSDIKSRPLNRSESAHVFELQYNGVRGVYIHNTNPDQSISIGDLEVKASFAYITFDANDDIAYAVAVDDAKIVYKNKEYDYIRMVENKGFYDDKK